MRRSPRFSDCDMTLMPPRLHHVSPVLLAQIVLELLEHGRGLVEVALDDLGVVRGARLDPALIGVRAGQDALIPNARISIKSNKDLKGAFLSGTLA